MTIEKFLNTEEHWRVSKDRDTLNAFKEFAKYHVKKALKSVKENIKVDIDEYGNVKGYKERMESSILNAYPEENIV